MILSSFEYETIQISSFLGGLKLGGDNSRAPPLYETLSLSLPSSHVHPYLLADNRHYPFYVWKKIFQRHEAVKYLLVPVFSVTTLFFIYALCEPLVCVSVYSRTPLIRTP